MDLDQLYPLASSNHNNKYHSVSSKSGLINLAEADDNDINNNLDDTIDMMASDAQLDDENLMKNDSPGIE